jgi:hypothetical protein
MGELAKEDRERIERRIAELQARIGELQPWLAFLGSATILNWVALFRERDALVEQLRSDSSEIPSDHDQRA